jgi:hypothetical protein
MKLLDGGTYIKSIAATSQAGRLGFDETSLESMSIEEQMACQWLVQNQKTLEEMRGRNNYMILNYDGFCLDPERDAQDLFDLVGLGWAEQTRDFVALSSQSEGSSRYFGLLRHSRHELDKWQKELDPGQIERILSIIGRAEIGSLYASPSALSSQARDSEPGQAPKMMSDTKIVPFQPKIA